MPKLTDDLLRRFTQEALPPDGSVFVLDVRVSDSPVRPKARVILDGDQSVDIDTCALVSRRVNRRLEEELGEEASYVLEVTSPGVDYPQTLPRQFPRHVGRQLVVARTDGTEVTGTLESVTPEGLTLVPAPVKRPKKAAPAAEAPAAPATVQVSFRDLKHAIVQISFK